MNNRITTVEQIFSHLPLAQVVTKCSDTFELYGVSTFNPNREAIARILSREGLSNMSPEGLSNMVEHAEYIVQCRLDNLQAKMGGF